MRSRAAQTLSKFVPFFWLHYRNRGGNAANRSHNVIHIIGKANKFSSRGHECSCENPVKIGCCFPHRTHLYLNPAHPKFYCHCKRRFSKATEVIALLADNA